MAGPAQEGACVVFPFSIFRGGEMRREQSEEKGAEERPEIGGGRAAWLLMARGAAKSLRREETAHETAGPPCGPPPRGIFVLLRCAYICACFLFVE